MRLLIIQKLNFLTRLPKKILMLLLAVWFIATVPICVAVYSYFQAQFIADLQNKQVNQEKVLTQVFERSARFGDLVNARSDIENLGSSFGLQSMLACKDGVDLIGGLTRVPCGPEDRSYRVVVAGTDIQLQFVWSKSSFISEPLLLRAVLGTAVISFMVFAVITWIIYNSLLVKIRGLASRISISDINSGSEIDYDIPEFKPIVVAISDLQSRVRTANEKIASLRAAEAVANLARQVAHDIRSPLSALKIFAAKASLSPEVSPLVRGAIDRIQGIANDLLGLRSHDELGAVGPGFFQEFIALKNAENRGRGEVFLETRFNQDLTIPFSQNKMFRCLSNIVNNSFEASASTDARVHLAVEIKNGLLVIELKDNGRGIPETVLSRLGEDRFSFGKSGGFGMGLSYVFATIRGVEGQVEIDSMLSVGTTVRLKIPVITT